MAKKPKIPAPEESTASAQPYYLQRAHIKDFRSIRDAKVEFKPGLNIIIGANGSGKTNFVRVLQNVLTTNTHSRGKENDFIFLGPHSIKLNQTRRVDLDALNGSGNFVNSDKNKWQETLIIDGLDYSANGSSNYWLGINKQRMIEKKRQVPKPNELLTINYGIPVEYQLVASDAGLSLDNYSLGTSGYFTRFGGTIVRGIHNSVFNAYVQSGSESEDLMDASVVNEIIEKVVEFNLERMRESLMAYSQISDVRLSKSARVYTSRIQNEIIVKGLIIEFFVNSEWLPFSALSSGTQRLFYIISEIMSPIQFYLAEKSEKGYFLNESYQTIVLEEPELGIHPDQLHKLLLFLREQSEKHQIIITTHSPQVLNMLKDDELDRITICELDEKKGTQFRKLKKAQIATAKKYMHEHGLYLSDYWLYGSLEETN